MLMSLLATQQTEKDARPLARGPTGPIGPTAPVNVAELTIVQGNASVKKLRQNMD